MEERKKNIVRATQSSDENISVFEVHVKFTSKNSFFYSQSNGKKIKTSVCLIDSDNSDTGSPARSNFWGKSKGFA